MRVISGSAKGTRLHGATGRRVRPMLDRVKESLFDLIGEKLRNARVLDLFAGVGSLGIEALSRGAGSAVFVESHRPTARAILANLERAKLQSAGKVIVSRLPGALSALGGEFDLIFVDPPFRIEKRILREVFQRLAGMRLVAPEGLVVFHGKPGEDFRPDGEIWELFDRREYGDSVVFIYRLKEPDHWERVDHF